MPAAIAIPAIATAVAGGTAAGASIYGAHKQAGASRRASDVTARADAAAMEENRARDAEAKRQFDATQELERQKYAAAEEERAYTRRLQEEREARAAPYRQASLAALGNLGQMLGIDFGGSPMGQSLSAPRTAGSSMAPTQTSQGLSNPMVMPTQSGPMGPQQTIGTLTGLRPRRPLRRTV